MINHTDPERAALVAELADATARFDRTLSDEARRAYFDLDSAENALDAHDEQVRLRALAEHFELPRGVAELVIGHLIDLPVDRLARCCEPDDEEARS